ncbi:hypothetical protein G6F57_021124 [Rhizopus arrhizus]|nr:hypothetical protein G6F22_019660 [Rhizopus arrhizus]KAG1435444.1 hypothetical protein G6F57_021124 [Rhizopus arrhizus]
MVAPTSSSPLATRPSTAWPVPSRKQVDHRRDADLQRAAVQIGGLAQFFRQLPHRFQHLQAALVHDPPGIRRPRGVAVADQQRRARFFLQLANHLAHRRLRDEQGFGRLREAGMPDRFDEIAQRTHVHGLETP